ncbi:MAG TPA: transposase [Terriglobia bacterium]|nr:transposase [Terriglobia bacterium]
MEYVPASWVVIEEACQKYACPKGCTVVTAEKPEAPIEKGLPGTGRLAHVGVSKYGDHLPLNRQEEIFRRQGVELPRQTMGDWMRCCAELLYPLYERMKKQAVGSKAAQTDDTPVPVLDVCGGRRTSVHGVRLHTQPQPRRTGGVPEGVSGISPGRRVLRVRSFL